MIELISESRCVKCNLCISVCPTDVFDQGADGIPMIARQDDCQTCFMCELYCPADAMYVSPFAEAREEVREAALEECGLLGGYREKVGWGPGRKPVSSHEYMHQLAVRAIP
ncbi:hypothetical protein YSY43_33520 [Paenibacillus sp. YSY-4.3]